MINSYTLDAKSIMICQYCMEYFCEVICQPKYEIKRFFIICYAWFITSFQQQKVIRKKHEKVAELPNSLYKMYLIFCHFFFLFIAHSEFALACHGNGLFCLFLLLVTNITVTINVLELMFLFHYQIFCEKNQLPLNRL